MKQARDLQYKSQTKTQAMPKEGARVPESALGC